MAQRITVEVFAADCSRDPRAKELMSVLSYLSFCLRSQVDLRSSCTSTACGGTPEVVVNGISLGTLTLPGLVDYLHLLAMGFAPNHLMAA